MIFGSDVMFIGTFEKIRADYLLFLAENGIKIKIWGRSTGKLRLAFFNEGRHALAVFSRGRISISICY